MIDVSKQTQSVILGIREAETDTFSELVSLSRLRPASDFTHANLQFVDFTGSDLSEFNFEYADLRGAYWDLETSFEPSHYTYALRGRMFDPISATDHAQISERALAARTWGERFFAFALAVDNFGEVNLTFQILRKVVKSDSSKYMKFCSYLYFLSSFFNIEESIEYCRIMAYQSNSYSNIFRFKKLKRLTFEITQYAKSTTRTMRYPGQVSVEMIVSQHRHLSR